jgi:hypothetical protein
MRPWFRTLAPPKTGEKKTKREKTILIKLEMKKRILQQMPLKSKRSLGKSLKMCFLINWKISKKWINF